VPREHRIMITSFELCFNFINIHIESESHCFYHNPVFFSCNRILRVHYPINCGKLSVGVQVQHLVDEPGVIPSNPNELSGSSSVIIFLLDFIFSPEIEVFGLISVSCLFGLSLWLNNVIITLSQPFVIGLTPSHTHCQFFTLSHTLCFPNHRVLSPFGIYIFLICRDRSTFS